MNRSPVLAVSLLGASAAPTHQAISAYLGRRLGVALDTPTGGDWPAHWAMLRAGKAQLGFLCGLLYTQHSAQFELLAAPVMAAERYRAEPIYFSDVVVASGSAFKSFADLRGARWAFNEPNSFSGYIAVLAHLHARTLGRNYFASWHEMGSHLAALQAVAAGAADGAAIDSIVLAAAMREQPTLAQQVRCVATIGPSPVPPVVAHHSLAPTLRAALREALLAMHNDKEGAQIMQSGLISRFVGVDDASYNALRRKAKQAGEVAP